MEDNMEFIDEVESDVDSLGADAVSEKLIFRLSSLRLSVAITIYPVGHYAHEIQ